MVYDWRSLVMIDSFGHTTTSVYDAAYNQIAAIDRLGNRVRLLGTICQGGNSWRA
jgi:hypothetical protein